MSHPGYDIDILIGKALAGELMPEEKKTLDRWLSASEENRRHYRQMMTLFNGTKELKEHQSYDTDRAWMKLKERLRQQPQGKQRTLVSPMKIYWRAAAVILFAFGLGYLAYSRFIQPQDKVTVAAAQRTQTEVLPDSTHAVLNKDSKLTYAYNPLKKRRVVTLTGEAHFDITHKENKTFMIEAGGVIIEDVGTVFNVRAYPEDSTIRVAVQSGEVSFYTADNPGIRLAEGETGVYDKRNGSFAKLDTVNENALAYATGVFVFHNTRLEEVVEAINEVYDRKLVLGNPALNDCRITVTFRNEKIDVIADVIAETLKLTTQEKENQITLIGDGCNN